MGRKVALKIGGLTQNLFNTHSPRLTGEQVPCMPRQQPAFHAPDRSCRHSWEKIQRWKQGFSESYTLDTEALSTFPESQDVHSQIYTLQAGYQMHRPRRIWPVREKRYENQRLPHDMVIQLTLVNLRPQLCSWPKESPLQSGRCGAGGVPHSLTHSRKHEWIVQYAPQMDHPCWDGLTTPAGQASLGAHALPQVCLQPPGHPV